ncbi:CbtA family protein [Hydrogenophaga sp. BPS33]|uniref:CbtA family protein n=1 Tax=Hydrogenophaga sp. BPS33 TaxID=2651974 RepID=UPI00131F9000|nr:CbtA family protein [Hydrogenophaga sp. BPS33]QHE86587.1 CbtA family protein [Hydrogenophaga sp. BPS33]
MIFQRLIWASLVVALAVGIVQTGVQRLQAVPIILAAEVFEDQKIEAPAAEAAEPKAHAGHDGHAMAEEAEEWAPAEGFDRTAWTFVANVLHAFSMALLVFAVMGVTVWRGTRLRALPLALVTAAAGWLVFYLWPSIGLHAEIPGMDAARLGSRQGWWTLAAVSAAAACAIAAGMRSHLRWIIAAALLALPFVVGAPHITADPLAGFQGEAQVVLRDLGTQFVWATRWVSISFWVLMGLACGWAFQRWVQPALQDTLGSVGKLPKTA